MYSYYMQSLQLDQVCIPVRTIQAVQPYLTSALPAAEVKKPVSCCSVGRGGGGGGGLASPNRLSTGTVQIAAPSGISLLDTVSLCARISVCIV